MIRLSQLIFQAKSHRREIAKLASIAHYSCQSHKMIEEEQKEKQTKSQLMDYICHKEDINKAFEAHERNMMAALSRVKDSTNLFQL